MVRHDRVAAIGRTQVIAPHAAPAVDFHDAPADEGRACRFLAGPGAVAHHVNRLGGPCGDADVAPRLGWAVESTMARFREDRVELRKREPGHRIVAMDDDRDGIDETEMPVAPSSDR